MGQPVHIHHGENRKVERSYRLDRHKKFKSKEELLRAVRKYRYNISRKVLDFKSTNEVFKGAQGKSVGKDLH